MDLDLIKKKIGEVNVVEELMMLGEKIFKKNEDAVCVVTYLIEKAYLMGKANHKVIQEDDGD